MYIDRGKLINLIGKNSMIDNMVHIGHNVILVIMHVLAQTGISGVVIGKNVTIGGKLPGIY